MVESFEKLEIPEEERIFQQDNDPKYTSRKASQWFKDNDIQVIRLLRVLRFDLNKRSMMVGI